MDPGYLLAAMVAGLLGMAMMMYGKKAGDFRVLLVGAVLSIETIFLSSAASLLVGTSVTMAAFYAWRKWLPA